MTNSPLGTDARIAVVIGSAGIKSLAALPFFDFFKQHNIYPSITLGSGGGAALAAMVACGIPSSDIPLYMTELYNHDKIVKFDFTTLFQIAKGNTTDISHALLDSHPFWNICHQIFQDKQLQECSLKVHIQATDLHSAKEVILTDVNVADAVYATNATYPFFPPIYLKESWVVDGIYTAPFPILSAHQYNPNLIIAIDFNRDYDPHSTDFLEYYINFFNRSFSVCHIKQTSLAMMSSDVETLFIKINFPIPMNIWDIEHAQKIIEAGNSYLQMHSQTILDICSGIASQKLRPSLL